MRKANVIIMNYKEFEELVFKVSNGHAGLCCDHEGWFYTVDEEYDCDCVNNDLSVLLNVTVKTIRIDLSADEDNVIIIYE